jgi:hypothetical protein
MRDRPTGMAPTTVAGLRWKRTDKGWVQSDPKLVKVAS